MAGHAAAATLVHIANELGFQATCDRDRRLLGLKGGAAASAAAALSGGRVFSRPLS